MLKAIVVAVGLALSGSALGQAVEDSTDRFTGARLIKYMNPAPSTESQPRIAAAIQVKDSTQTASIAISTVAYSNRSGSSSWRYLRCHTLNWLVDGKPLVMGRVIHSGDTFRGGVTERIIQVLEVDQLRQLSSGTLVEYKLCNDEYQLTADDLVGFREMLTALDAPAK